MAASFAELFKKYRLKSELETLSDFGNALAEKGFLYEDSIFSHWQKGSRVPQNRAILLKILEIFIEHGAINTVDQANKLISSANQGILSELEMQKLSLDSRKNVFQVPSEINNFTGRKEIIAYLTQLPDLKGKVILIHGPAGVGKTSLAIKLGHLLQERYEDGVLWYKVEEDNLSDILLSIAKTLGEDISNVSDLQVRGTIVRSLLAGKNVLLFLDSAETSKNINLLIPNSKFCTTIITSQKINFKSPIPFLDIQLSSFTESEVLALFKDVLKEKYDQTNKNLLIKVAKRVGNLPLAVHILARNLSQKRSLLANPDIISSSSIQGESIDSAIALSYDKLDSLNKTVLISSSVFKGKDFSSKAIGYINGLSDSESLAILQSLTDLSLLEHSAKSRYRIHPAIKEFARKKLGYSHSSYLSWSAFLIFIFLALWWVDLQFYVNIYGSLLFSTSYGVLALYGGICGINTSFNWGGLKTVMGRSILFFSLGLFAQELGQIAYSIYINIQKIPVPYPSLGDIGYFGTIPLYIYGSLLLAKSSGIEVSFRSIRKKIIALVIPLVMLTVSYLFFLKDYHYNFNDPFRILLDFGYPLGESIYISIAIVIFIFSRDVLDGIMRSKAFLVLIALLIQFLADFTFLSNSPSFYSGNYVDFIYLAAYFTMTISLLSLRSIQVKVNV